ncbi:hypothetical protein [Streptomyces chiangmaiensis]|uniref:Uncharacterized protein n=1 Tax=Streptomyces chiangmaiensis TaxID=766497 RepID=A0ABU7FW08_9ACTN|nr:hypothetical protein [Streptomyces chiangmaiensis]MED7828300.1 hypothetical protein [Streptomyces chiangmaiensis]
MRMDGCAATGALMGAEIACTGTPPPKVRTDESAAARAAAVARDRIGADEAPAPPASRRRPPDVVATTSADARRVPDGPDQVRSLAGGMHPAKAVEPGDCPRHVGARSREPLTFWRRHQLGVGRAVMMRRVAAAVVLLAVAVLMNFMTSHHSPSASSAVSAMAPAIESESRKPHGSAFLPPHVGAAAQHHETAAEAPARPPRTDHHLERLALAADAVPRAAAAMLAETAPHRAHPRTAREACNPGAGRTPDSATLQTFRL